ncbi:MAG: chemotaxis protein CheA, partial [Armatimonadetes bacterium]|nr:chemotaxis protein CheA [Armatimonadota bacterium]NIO97200.1 chemotaxis protein CheA [Armatimonadota bacterium]
TKEIIDLSLSMRDRILAMLDEGQAAGEEQDSIGQAFRKILEGAGVSKGVSDTATGVKNETGTSGGKVTYRIHFRPPKDIFLTGTNPIGLINELRGLGRCTVVARTGEIPLLEEIDPEFCYTYWDVILTTDRGRKEIEDVFIFVEHDSEVNIEAIHSGSGLDSEDCHRELGALLAMSADISTEDIIETISSMSITADAEENSEPTDPGTPEQAVDGRGSYEKLSSIRVPSGKLDKLVDLVGELVTTQARLTQATSTKGDTELQVIAEEVERLTEELRDNAMSLRMVPIGPTFKSFRRLVRDLSRELGKEVELITDGEETELDKKMIEKINEPLVHIIRNSIGHGIESPEARKAAGKKKAG